jgi:hypothetical protein
MRHEVETRSHFETGTRVHHVLRVHFVHAVIEERHVRTVHVEGRAADVLIRTNVTNVIPQDAESCVGISSGTVRKRLAGCGTRVVRTFDKLIAGRDF